MKWRKPKLPKTTSLK